MVNATQTPFLDEFSDEVPTKYLNEEDGSTFSFEQLIGGYGHGAGYGGFGSDTDHKTVFQIEPNLVRHFQQMLDTDGKAQSVENMLIFPIIAAQTEIMPSAKDNGESDAIRKILTSASYEDGMKTPLEMIIMQMAKGMVFKKAFFERVPKLREDGMYGYEKIAWRPSETCELALDARTGSYKGFRQQKIDYSMQSVVSQELGYVNINLDKAFVYVYGAWADPIEGISAMQVPYWCFQTKRRLMLLWYQYLENTSLPKTLVHNRDEEKARQDAKRVATLKSRGVLGLKDDSTVSTLESSGEGAGQFVEAIRFLDSEMSHSILAGFMDLSSSAASGKGSFALSEDQSKLFLRTRRVVAWDMARQFNEQVIAPLVRWNFGKKASYPKLVFGPLSETNEQILIDTFTQLATAASNGIAVPDDFYDMLVVRVASALELDVDKVQKAIDTDGSPLEKLREATNTALGAMQVNQMNQNGQTSTTPEQFLQEAASRKQSSNGSGNNG